jgi:transcriptional regulator with XRE-family HTH domain
MSTQIKLLRRARDWSQRQLARRADMTEADVSRIESGRLRPYKGQARRLARALGVRVEELFPAPLDHRE